MNDQTFREYLKSSFPLKKSGTISSYSRAIKILDDIFRQNDIFGLNGKSLTEITDPNLMKHIIEYVVDEEYNYKKGQQSIFDLIPPNQTSYPKKGFCRAALKKLGEYVDLIYREKNLN